MFEFEEQEMIRREAEAKQRAEEEKALDLSNFKALMWHLDINVGLKKDLNCFNLL